MTDNPSGSTGQNVTAPANAPAGSDSSDERAVMYHNLKTWPAFFAEVEADRKTFEIRKNDRGFRVGDTLRLIEYDPETDAATGRVTERVVSYLTPFPAGLKPGFVCMGFAGFTRAHHDGERVARSYAERHAPTSAERRALAEQLYLILDREPGHTVFGMAPEDVRDKWTRAADDLHIAGWGRARYATDIVALEAERDALAAKLATAEGWDRVWRDRVAAAESRAAALAFVVSTEATRLHLASMATRMTTGADATESLMCTAAMKLREALRAAALAGNGNGTGEGATAYACEWCNDGTRPESGAGIWSLYHDGDCRRCGRSEKPLPAAPPTAGETKA